jgi:two-component system, LytTR family, response regulator
MAVASADRIAVKMHGRVILVRTAEIDWVEACGNYVTLHVGRTQHMLRRTMSRLHSCLDPHLFFRIHRSHIVNVERIRELQPLDNGEWLVILCDGVRLTLSRSYRDQLHERLGF